MQWPPTHGGYQMWREFVMYHVLLGAPSLHSRVAPHVRQGGRQRRGGDPHAAAGGELRRHRIDENLLMRITVTDKETLSKNNPRFLLAIVAFALVLWWCLSRNGQMNSNNNNKKKKKNQMMWLPPAVSGVVPRACMIHV